MSKSGIAQYELDFFSTPEEPRLVKRRRVETAADQRLAPQTHQQPTCVRATFSSSVHNGTAYGGSSQACCHQFKLADQLYLALYTRGRAHTGTLSVSFTSSPAAFAASSCRRCSFAEWQGSWGPDVTVSKTTTVRSNGIPAIVDDCGLTITLTANGRAARMSLLVLDAPMQRTCTTCKILSVSEVAAAQTEEGLVL